jgi:hypothetical protein
MWGRNSYKFKIPGTAGAVLVIAAIAARRENDNINKKTIFAQDSHDKFDCSNQSLRKPAPI